MYEKRHSQLNELIRVIEIMRMDILFGLYTLEEIFQRIGERKEISFSEFFKDMAISMESDRTKTLNEILNENIKNLQKNSYLQNEETEEFKKLILTLGKSDIDSQARMIDLTIENIKSMTTSTKEDIDKKGKVYKKLSTIIGLAIVIILF
jgi:stage III sporulation protein AB